MLDCNSINARHQSIDCSLAYRILQSRVLDVAVRVNLPLRIFYDCHMAANYSSMCTNDWLGMVVWCYFKMSCHFNTSLYFYIFNYSLRPTEDDLVSFLVCPN